MSKFKNYLKKFTPRYLKLKTSSLFRKIKPYGIIIPKSSFFEKPNLVIGGGNMHIGESCTIGHSAWLAAYENYRGQCFKPKLIIGNNVKIGNFVCITCIDEITVEDGCLFSEYVYISDHYHGYDPIDNIEPAKQPLFSKGKVRIGCNTFVGYRVTILSGVTIGKNCVIGAHSVVTKSFPDYSMVAGVPAKIIKRYDFERRDWISID